MRRNYTVRPSTLVENYDVIYEFYPDRPEVSKIIDHRRKLVTINMDADPYFSAPVVIDFEEPKMLWDNEEGEC